MEHPSQRVRPPISSGAFWMTGKPEVMPGQKPSSGKSAQAGLSISKDGLRGCDLILHCPIETDPLTNTSKRQGFSVLKGATFLVERSILGPM